MSDRRFVLRALAAALLVAAGAPVLAQGSDALSSAATSAQADLERSQAELRELRERIEQEKLPLNERLRDLEAALSAARREFDEVARALDTRNLELTSVQTENEALAQERRYLSNLLDEYVRNLESRVHITELASFREGLEQARRAPDNEALTPAEAFLAQTAAVERSIVRLDEVAGGQRFEGRAVGRGGRVEAVTFALLGPVALYASDESGSAGLAEQRLGSLEPNMVPLDTPELTAAARQVVQSGSGSLPLDPTLGNAQKVAATEESLVEHVMAGGPVMVPILLLALAALLVALWKWFQLARVRAPSQRRVQALLEDVRAGDHVAARQKASGLVGPTGEMLRAGLERLGEPKELIEEVMFEKMLETRLRLQSLLSFIAVSAAASPLLGLLGTVTGIINTFKLITVYGTGDAKTLSSGISEALITTEFGLIIAIPALLLHAYLSRKARRYVDGMEKTAVSFLNRLSPAEGPHPFAPPDPGEADRRPASIQAHGVARERVPVMAGSAPTDR